MNGVEKITTESGYRMAMAAIDALTKKGTLLGDMELLSEPDKAEYQRLAELVYEWERVYYPLPITVIVTPNERMATLRLRQRAARLVEA